MSKNVIQRIPEADKAMPLVQHLQELRKRFLLVGLMFFVCFALCYYFSHFLLSVLIWPLVKSFPSSSSHHLIYTGLTEAFLTHLKVSCFAAFILTFPLLAAHVWRFASPGLFPHEKKALWPFIIGSPILFVMGMAIAYFIVIPLAWRFFLSFEAPSTALGIPLEFMPKINEYLSMTLSLLVLFGLSFQLPLVVMILVQLHILDITYLAKYRKYAFLLIVIFAALFTPPDILSPLGLIIPLYGLYEASILFAKARQNKYSRQDTTVG